MCRLRFNLFGLFGDGAAAVIVVGDDHPCAGPEILATRSVFYPIRKT